VLTLCGLLLITHSPLEVVALLAFGGLMGMLLSLWLRPREAQSGKSRFQFRLRTLMIVVTLLAADCGYLAWQAKIVRERKATLAEIEASGGAFVSYTPVSLFSQSRFDIEREVGRIPHFDPRRYLPHFDRVQSAIRRWLGDEIVFDIWLPDTVPLSEINRIERCFPEAAVQRGEPADQTSPPAPVKR
jgi:hypothetical protein